MNARGARYSAIAILLHWAIAGAIVGNVALGWWMHSAIDVPETAARAIAVFQVHKSLGLVVLALSLLRLAWRLLHAPPPLPAAAPAWERTAARLTHGAFYVLMLVLPFSGWLYASAQWRGTAPLNVPTLWFGLFAVPHLFGLDQASQATRAAVAAATLDVHAWLAWGTMALLVLHVGAALKHQFGDRDVVLSRMLPLAGVPGGQPTPREWPRSLVLWCGSAAIVMAAVAVAWAVVKPPAAVPVAESAIGDLPGGNWSVDPGSGILFSGAHAGLPFEGRFTRWRAGIRFDPADPGNASVTAEIDTASARDGNALHEETLPQPEWFDTARHPLATFRSTAIQARGDGQFDVAGALTIKGRELVLEPLTLTVDGPRLTIDGHVTIRRRDADLGMESDPEAAYVSAAIPVTVRVQAQRRP
ncbi:Cytochrome b561 [Gammaproteobacteria bacterium]|nr:cytochrome b/b6 domain-containing protein [Gammaproteobacteria bacterium]CAG0942439.1 Cytochrome b561 [Gammaproteobacteria bacterium]